MLSTWEMFQHRGASLSEQHIVQICVTVAHKHAMNSSRVCDCLRSGQVYIL